jgi:hypothetical protein
MTSAGLLIAVIIIWFEIVIFACPMTLPVAGVFYFSGADQSAHLVARKTLEGE